MSEEWVEALRKQKMRRETYDVLLDVAAAATKYVPLERPWRAWNNQDGDTWPELDAALRRLDSHS